MNFIDVLELFQRDPRTEGIILVGEIGGSDEEAAADYIRRFVAKPVVAYVAGVTAPAGKRMGHAGAIVAGGKGTAADKYAAFEAAGVRTVKSPAELGTAMNELLRERRSRARRGAPARAPAARPASTAAKGRKPAARSAKRVVAGPKARAPAAPRRLPARKAARASQRPAQGRRRRVVKQ
jgi:succinyl-CoA synthetase alpha subunit